MAAERRFSRPDTLEFPLPAEIGQVTNDALRLYNLGLAGQAPAGWNVSAGAEGVQFTQIVDNLQATSYALRVALPDSVSGVDVTSVKTTLRVDTYRDDSEREERTYRLRPDLPPHHQPAVVGKLYDGDRYLNGDSFVQREQPRSRQLSAAVLKGLSEDLRFVEQGRDNTGQNRNVNRSKPGPLTRLLGKLSFQ